MEYYKGVARKNNRLMVGMVAAGGLLVVSVGVNVWQWKTHRDELKVVQVVDGDTFHLKNGLRVRLAGVDAPAVDLCMGAEAKLALEKLILGKVVRLENPNHDEWGRLMARVYRGNVVVDVEMLRQGMGRMEYQTAQENKPLIQVRNEAKARGVGIYSARCQSTADISEQGCEIKGNIGRQDGEKRYFVPGCPQYGQITIEYDLGEKYFCSSQEAEAAGYVLGESCPTSPANTVGAD